LHCGKPIDNGFEMYTCEGDLDMEWDAMMPAQSNAADKLIGEFWLAHVHPKPMLDEEDSDDPSSEGRVARQPRG
jgi:hypothetical protein